MVAPRPPEPPDRLGCCRSSASECARSRRSLMSRVPLTFACGLYDRLVPLFMKESVPDGLDLNTMVINEPRAIFDRMGGAAEFDFAEFSLSELIASHALGDDRFIGIPFFPARVFRHSMITINKRSNIK